MKKIHLRFVSAMLAIMLLPGCGTTQDAEAPTSINQAMLIEQSSQEQPAYTFPETFTGDWTSQEGKLTIHADAQVVAEQGVILPTATVTPREFTQADVDNLLKVFLKGEPLYDHVQTKQELQDSLDYINSPEWSSDPDSPERSPEQLEARRKELNAYYAAEIEKAPDEKPIIHGFSDSRYPDRISAFTIVDGVEYDVSINNGAWKSAEIIRKDYKYAQDATRAEISKEDAIAQADALIRELGFSEFALDDAQEWETGVWRLYYAPTVNGIRLPSIRQDMYRADGERSHYQYWNYSSSEESNADKVSWWMENVQLYVGKEGILSFTWTSPSGETVIKENQTALLPFDQIVSIANTMLPAVIIGPSEARSLVELDQINGFDTHMDVNITKVSLSLMRIRDKGSLQGMIVPVWDFWGTKNWYPLEEEPWDEGNYEYECLMTLNAIDGNVVSRLFGY